MPASLEACPTVTKRPLEVVFLMFHYTPLPHRNSVIDVTEHFARVPAR